MFLRTKFFGASRMMVIPDGTLSIFSAGVPGPNSAIYTYSSDTSAAGVTFAQTITGSVGNAKVGLFTGTTINYRYTFSNGAVATANSGIAINNGSAASGTGNGTRGVVCINNVSTHGATRSYWYATDTVTDTALLPNYVFEGTATGNSAVAIFAIGSSNNALNSTSVITNKYVYSGDTTSTGGSLTSGLCNGEATSNGTFGIIQVGAKTGSANTNKYTYSSDTAAVAVSLLASTGGSGGNNGASGPSTFGLFRIGTGNTNKYQYSPETVAAGGSIVSSSQASTSQANGTTGVTA